MEWEVGVAAASRQHQTPNAVNEDLTDQKYNLAEQYMFPDRKLNVYRQMRTSASAMHRTGEVTIRRVQNSTITACLSVHSDLKL